MKEQIKEALESIREDWEWWQYPQGGYEIFERESRAIVAYSYPTDQNGRFDGKMIAHVPTWLRWQNERIEELEDAVDKAILEIRIWANCYGDSESKKVAERVVEELRTTIALRKEQTP